MRRATATLLLIAACGNPTGGVAPAVPGPVEQTPPTGSVEEVDAWIARGHYRAWRCEPAPHDQRPPSAHPRQNRICNNDALVAAAATGLLPVGAASVKELFDDGGQLTGHAVSLRALAGGGGESWFWWERTAPGEGGVQAFGLGTENRPRTLCANCHAGAPQDFVFTRVP